MSDFVMPSLGADMEAGTLLEWYVKPGDTVKRGDIVALVDTSKAEIEVEIFEDGVIGELLVPVGVRVPVGTALATAPRAGAGAEAPAQSRRRRRRARSSRGAGATACARPRHRARARRAAPADPRAHRGRRESPASGLTACAARGRAARRGPLGGHGQRTERRDHEERRGAGLVDGGPAGASPSRAALPG